MRGSDLNNEQELLLEISKGNEQAFDLIFRHYHAYVYTSAFRFLNSSSLAEEVVQDVFLKLWQKRSILKDIKFFPAFLYKVAANITYSTARKEALKEKYEGTFKALYAHNAEDPQDLASKEFVSILNNAVNQLPPKQQAAYRLVKEEGLKRDQAAQQLNVSNETIKSNLDEAMKRIRAYFYAKTGIGITLLFIISRIF